MEFFTTDLNNDYWDTFFEDQGENYFNTFTSYLFFTLRNIPEEHCIKSIFGKIVIYFGGIIGMLISSYFIYYVNNLISLTSEEQDAYSKLTKLLDPINKEHKASNLLKAILLLKKNVKDNQNTEKDYRLKMEDLRRPFQNQRRPIFKTDSKFQFAFNSDGNSNTLVNLNEQNNNEEKRKFIKYLGNIFLLKIKLAVERKDFLDNLKIARNSSQSFNDVLKTIGNKMDANINQLNNKLEVLIKNDQKFLNFIKFTTTVIKNIKKISNYHNNLLQTMKLQKSLIINYNIL